MPILNNMPYEVTVSMNRYPVKVSRSININMQVATQNSDNMEIKLKALYSEAYSLFDDFRVFLLGRWLSAGWIERKGELLSLPKDQINSIRNQIAELDPHKTYWSKPWSQSSNIGQYSNNVSGLINCLSFFVGIINASAKSYVKFSSAPSDPLFVEYANRVSALASKWNAMQPDLKIANYEAQKEAEEEGGVIGKVTSGFGKMLWGIAKPVLIIGAIGLGGYLLVTKVIPKAIAARALTSAFRGGEEGY